MVPVSRAASFRRSCRPASAAGRLGDAQTLAISAVGTLLAALVGIALAVPGAGRVGRWARLASRLVLNVLRSIPRSSGRLMVLAAGLGPFAARSRWPRTPAGVLGRLFAEALENAPSERPTLCATPAHRDRDVLLRVAACGDAAAALVHALPLENNIRMATVLGVVGAGGLGQMLFVSLSLFKQDERRPC